MYQILSDAFEFRQTSGIIHDGPESDYCNFEKCHLIAVMTS